MQISFSVSAADSGRRLKNFLQQKDRLSTSLWRKIKWNGTILRNGLPIGPNDLLAAGDTILCSWEEDTPIFPADVPLDIIYEDEDLLVVNKPAGMLIHPTGRFTRETLVSAVAGYYRKKGIKAGIHPVYRLDRDTTGLVLIAKSAHAQHQLSQSHDCIQRDYLALAEGTWPQTTGTLTFPLARDPKAECRFRVDENGRPAITEYTVLKQYRDFALVKFHLLTGRTHQIRVHCASIGHPLLGDALYRGPTGLLSRQALHAWKISFHHPRTGTELSLTVLPPQPFTACIPENWQQVLDSTPDSL